MTPRVRVRVPAQDEAGVAVPGEGGRLPVGGATGKPSAGSMTNAPAEGGPGQGDGRPQGATTGQASTARVAGEGVGRGRPSAGLAPQEAEAHARVALPGNQAPRSAAYAPVGRTRTAARAAPGEPGPTAHPPQEPPRCCAPGPYLLRAATAVRHRGPPHASTSTGRCRSGSPTGTAPAGPMLGQAGAGRRPRAGLERHASASAPGPVRPDALRNDPDLPLRERTRTLWRLLHESGAGRARGPVVLTGRPAPPDGPPVAARRPAQAARRSARLRCSATARS